LKLFTSHRTAVAGAIAFLVATPVIAKTPILNSDKSSGAVSIVKVPTKATKSISESEVVAAQKAWGEALVSISTTYEQKGITAAKSLAEKTIDSAYGYQFGPVLFKPTLTVSPQTFRTTKAGALAYFVGGNPAFPNDTGFALKGWRKVEVRNAAIMLSGGTATSMGNVMITDKSGKVTTVDKTWTYMKDDSGKLRIVGHHSSLPYTAK
jgi:hypothetical protein